MTAAAPSGVVTFLFTDVEGSHPSLGGRRGWRAGWSACPSQCLAAIACARPLNAAWIGLG
jgi:hypothetical protein